MVPVVVSSFTSGYTSSHTNRSERFGTSNGKEILVVSLKYDKILPVLFLELFIE